MAAQPQASNSPQFDLDAFVRRLGVLYRSWDEHQAGTWGGAHALAVATPLPSEDMRYLKSTTLQIWLLGYEFPETVMVFLKGAVHVVCSQKKATHLAPVQAASRSRAGVEMVVHPKAKNEDGSVQMGEVLRAVKAAEGAEDGRVVVGVLQKEQPDGPVMKKWSDVLSSAEGVEQVDVSGALGDVFAVKEPSEVMNIRKAAYLGARVLKDFVVPKLESTIDDEKQISHEKLMELTEEVVTEPAKINVKLKAENCDICYPPVFQSGGQFDLKASAMSNEENLCYSSGGVILCSIGARYDSYCANVARTYLVDPSPAQETAYKVLLRAQEAAIAAIKPGQRMCDVYKAAAGVLEKEAPELLPHLTKNGGTGIGIEFRESGLVLSAKNEKVMAPGMVFNVVLGLQGLKNDASDDPKTKDYALLLADTVVVTRGASAVGAPQMQSEKPVATALCTKAPSDVSYSLRGDEEEDEQENRGPAAPGISEGTRGARRAATDGGMLHSHLRSDSQEASKEQLRQKHQQELAKQKLQETARRLAAGGLDKPQGEGLKRGGGEVAAYRTMEEIPMPPRELKIQVDQAHEAVLLPIYGLMVPFHISLVRSVTEQPDNGQSFIRIVFNVPGAGFSASDYASQQLSDSVFVKDISFRSADRRHAEEVVRLMKTMSKQVKQRESERADRASLVTQEKLQMAKGPLSRSLRLPDLWIRPAFATKGRKVSGVLEAHINGFKYSTNRADERLEVMYKNIKHAIFQPADNEMITLIHFHLLDPIMVGKKKTKDVQFFAEVMDVSQAVGGSRGRSAYDPDEIEEEQRERERRNKINREFEGFVKAVQAQWERDPVISKLDLEFDVPFRELGFHGVPHKSSAFLVPSVNCLLELIELPFFVVTLSEVEVVNLERVGQGQKTFDMAIVFKDFRRDVVRVDAIPSTSLDPVKTWLNQMNIKYYESKVNLSWKPILQNILSDPDGFVADGGWEFLNLEASDSGEESEEEDAYEPSDVDEVSEEEEEEDGENESVVDSEEDEESAEEEEEGLTWDELEEKAKREDKELGEESDSEEERKRRKQKAMARSGGSGSGAKPSSGMRPGPGGGGSGIPMKSGARPPMAGGAFPGAQRRPMPPQQGKPMQRPKPSMGGPPLKRPKH